MENKNEENENKIILGDLYYTYTIQNNTMDKMEGYDGNKKRKGMMEIKNKDFMDAVPIMFSLWIMT